MVLKYNLRDGISSPDAGKRFVSFHSIQTCSGVQQASYTKVAGVSFLEVKAAGT
jgi:hypothetical protein